MKRKKLISLLLSAVMLFSSAFSAFAEEVPEAENPEEKVMQYSNSLLKNMVKVYAHNIADNYYYGVDDNDLLFSVICDTIDNDGVFDINSAVEAMIGCLDDEHSEFFTREEFKALTENVSGEITGIGVTIFETEKGVTVLSVIKGSPAEVAGIREGDYITGVDGADVRGLSSSEVRNRVVGAPGTVVNVEITRGDDVFTVQCTRAHVDVPQTETKMIGDIAYLRLIQFTANSHNEVKEFIEELKAKKVKKLIFDLRDNPGGDLDAAHAIAELFISAGQLAQLRYKNKARDKFLYSKNYNAPGLKVAVLVNENSASASEFISIAFQGRKAGKIIGTNTFGKGSMQLLTSLATGAGMKFTIGEFFSIKGERVHTVGVTPDIEIENEFIPVDESQFEKIDYDLIGGEERDERMILALEERLYALDILSEKPDTVYDENTKEAVKSVQRALGYEPTGEAGFYEYLYLNDLNYDFEKEEDRQLEAAVEYLKGLK